MILQERDCGLLFKEAVYLALIFIVLEFNMQKSAKTIKIKENSSK
jgi:hypothetical protein